MRKTEAACRGKGWAGLASFLNTKHPFSCRPFSVGQAISDRVRFPKRLSLTPSMLQDVNEKVCELKIIPLVCKAEHRGRVDQGPGCFCLTKPKQSGR